MNTDAHQGERLCKCERGSHLLEQVYGGLQIQAEVDEAPLDALTLVLLLLQDEHGVVEQLLQLLVGVVDAQLLKGVQLQGKETCLWVRGVSKNSL